MWWWYRFLKGDETAWIPSGLAGTGTRPSPSSKKNKVWWTHFHEAGKYPQGMTLPQEYILGLCGQFPGGMTQSRVRSQQCLQPQRLALALTNRPWWWPCATLDEKLSNPEFLPLLSGSRQTQSLRTGQGSQRQTKQIAGGNASTAADRMWGSQRALPGTHFPDSLQKPLLGHVDPHAPTLQPYRDQQHLESCPKL